MTAVETFNGEFVPSLDKIVPIVLSELREIARHQLAREHSQFSLQTTDLVHEAYLRMVGQDGVTSRGRAYFFAAFARAMRHVLIDAARRRRAHKRGDGIAPVELLDAGAPRVDGYADDLLDIDDALRALGKFSPRHAHVVECRFFGGMTVDDTARALNISPRTVKSDWAFARAWLAQALHSGAA